MKKSLLCLFALAALLALTNDAEAGRRRGGRGHGGCGGGGCGCGQSAPPAQPAPGAGCGCPK